MDAIQQFAAVQTAYNDEIGAAIDTVVTAQSGISKDIETLLATIEKMNNSPGALSPEDEATFAKLVSQGSSLAEKSKAVAAALKALDELNPPTVPTV